MEDFSPDYSHFRAPGYDGINQSSDKSLFGGEGGLVGGEVQSIIHVDWGILCDDSCWCVGHFCGRDKGDDWWLWWVGGGSREGV